MRSREVRADNLRPGLAAVELAILLPLLVLLLLGTWEVGRMVEVNQLLTNAAREGGRQASTGTKTVAEIKAEVVRYLQQNDIDGVTIDDVTVTNLTDATRAEPTDAEQLDQFRVTVSVPVDSVRFILLDRVTGVTTLSAQSDWYSMRDLPITVNSTIPLN